MVLVVIAAITSCTNTSNPSVLITAGLLAKKAFEKGLKSKPWVKTSFAPGSKVVTEYLRDANLMEPLEALGFHIVGYGCTTCIGNSGPLPEVITKAIQENDLLAAAVLSGNRNFEGPRESKYALKLSCISTACCGVCTRRHNGYRLCKRSNWDWKKWRCPFF